MRALAIRQAEAEAAEVRSWTCETCDTMVEDEGPFCRSCAAYWRDLESEEARSFGLFDL